MLSVSSNWGGAGGGVGAETGDGAGERGGVTDRARSNGSDSNREVTLSRRSIKASNSEAGLWVTRSASLPDNKQEKH